MPEKRPMAEAKVPMVLLMETPKTTSKTPIAIETLPKLSLRLALIESLTPKEPGLIFLRQFLEQH
ncbi:MAG TPA: hypothetical protein VMW36_04255 [Patescibacteria group bacterium]|nr:hypothetical protein [Patescibacteria group bacterium]